jgi:ABC-2 type transport system ATP-binding protein
MCAVPAAGEARGVTTTSPAPAITVEGLHVSYGSTVAVDDVSFTVAPGEILGVLGPNGAGKTTTVEALVGLRRADRGRVDVLGHDPQRDPEAIRPLVGVQLQSAGLPEKITVAEAVALYSALYDDPADGDDLLERLGLGPHRGQRYGKLSGGQQQRLSIALALVGRPQVAVLDELSTGLDPQARREVWSLVEEVRDAGSTVLLVTHFMEEAERLCDRIVLVDDGRVTATGSPQDLVERTGGESQRMRFRVEGSADGLGSLTQLPEVFDVHRDGDRVVVTGHGDVILAVTAELFRRDVHAHDLRVDAVRLDDAFVALTQKEPA